jgi:hypothetical protein
VVGEKGVSRLRRLMGRRFTEWVGRLRTRCNIRYTFFALVTAGEVQRNSGDSVVFSSVDIKIAPDTR